MRDFRRTALALFICGAALRVAHPVAAQSAYDFTYSGSLKTNGNPASGSHDFEFSLFDALTDGEQVGETAAESGVAVAGGIFAVTLNFGPSAFPGADRFLEIRVRPSTGGAFTLLTPRTRVTGTPYAIRSLSAGTAEDAASLGSVAASDYVVTTDGRLSDARSPLPSSGSYIQNTTDAQETSAFNISGTGKADRFDAAAGYNVGGARAFLAYGANTYGGLDAGPTPPAGSSNSMFGYGAGRFQTGGNNTFVGAFAGSFQLGANSNTFLGSQAGYLNEQGAENTFVGHLAGANSRGSANSFFGTAAGYANNAGTKNTALGHNSNVSSGALDHASAIGADVIVTASNRVQIGRPGTDTVAIGAFASPASSAATVCVTAQGVFMDCSSSSGRYKEDVEPLNDGLDLVTRLEPISFRWKADHVADIGLLAEDVAAVAPSLVVHDRDGQITGVKYQRLNVLLINAVKEQQARIDAQSDALDRQAAELRALKQLICQTNAAAELCVEGAQ